MINLLPDLLTKSLRLLFSGQGLMKREKGTIIAMAVNPAANNINLVNLGFPNNCRSIAQRTSIRQQIQQRLLHCLLLMRGRALLNQATMANQKDLVTPLLSRWIDNKQVIGLDGPRNQTLTNQDFIGTPNNIA